MGEYGLASLASAVRRLLYGEGLEEVLHDLRRAGDATARSLSDTRFVETPLVVEYLAMLRRGLVLVSEAAAAAGNEALLAGFIAAAALGVYAGGEDCVLVRVKAAVEAGGGRVARRGGVVCMDARRAAYLSAAGLVEPVELLPGLAGGGTA